MPMKHLKLVFKKWALYKLKTPTVLLALARMCSKRNALLATPRVQLVHLSLATQALGVHALVKAMTLC